MQRAKASPGVDQELLRESLALHKKLASSHSNILPKGYELRSPYARPPGGIRISRGPHVKTVRISS